METNSVKQTVNGKIEEAIPAFLNLSPAKCRFILKRIHESWMNVRVEIEEIEINYDHPFAWGDVKSFISLGRNEIDHSNYELFLCQNSDRMYFNFESSKWALIQRV